MEYTAAISSGPASCDTFDMCQVSKALNLHLVSLHFLVNVHHLLGSFKTALMPDITAAKAFPVLGSGRLPTLCSCMDRGWLLEERCWLGLCAGVL